MEDATSEIDLERLLAERRKMNTFGNHGESSFQLIPFSLSLNPAEKLLRHYSRKPFYPEQKEVDLEAGFNSF
jgi:hypothetical protein